ncbi:AEC family transporter [Pseudenhygromyxa sp. WMMC2535]|uniref:AEC family transporter n=1 Tax=Pseudenhygromyxa sp. WMMC2535 TaxID=2712867 RepID=UPI001552081E|nr:AEC family transporter [Pseudenhygromyxa sp. WMMC2535]NVB42046.1 AEC family transporter [Pseudenhygromyxa sp. WMMC2535]
MSLSSDHLARLLGLVVPALAGALTGRLGLFFDPRAAVSVLNRYALYIAFPALVTRGLLLPSAGIPAQPAFWLLWPICLVLSLAIARGIRRPAVGLGISFGNVAYVGLPFIAAVMGDSVEGPAALAVAVHVTGAVTVGPAILAHASGAEGGLPAVARRVARMPLFWAPIVGLLARNSPSAARDLAGAALAPFAGSASAVALFLLGLHVYTERERVLGVGRAVLGLVGARMVLTPLLMLGLAFAAQRLGLLDPELGRLHVLLACMPLGITTFSMAHDAGVESERVAGAVVLSSLLALVMLPLWSLVSRLL